MDHFIRQLVATLVASPLTLWVLGSVLAYTGATNILWLIKSRDLRLPPYAGWPLEAGRFLYYLGIPYLALGGWPRPPLRGLLSLDDLGLVGPGPRWPPTRWLEAVGTGLGFGLAVLLLLLVAWTVAKRVGCDGGLHFPARPWWDILLDVLYLEVHWSFYRGALAVTLGDLYAGVFAGLALVLLEWSLDPFWRQGWRSASEAPAQWLRAALALAVALLFLYTRNLWVCLAVHGALELAFWGLGRERTAVI